MIRLWRSKIGLGLVCVLFLALALPGAGLRGVVAEEVQPTLRRHPVVLDVGADNRIERLPPYEANAPSRPRLVRTTQWPVLAWDGATRQWPLFIRGHQSALGAWVSLALMPMLGDGVSGLQRASVLLSVFLLVLTWVLARRLGLDDGATLATLLVATCFGTFFFARTGYAFEILSRVAMLATLVVASPARPLTTARALAIGLCAAIAILSRATIAVTLAPALLMLLTHQPRWKGLPRFVLVGVVAVGVPVLVAALAPFATGSQPLADLPWRQLADRPLQAPAHLFMQLAWLGDPGSVLGPLRAGTSPVPARLIASAVLSGVVACVALIRWWRGTVHEAERLFIASLIGNVCVGALLYESAAQFQLAMALEPLIALALIAQLRLVQGRVLVLIPILVRAISLAVGLHQDATIANPMFSGRAQRSAIAHLHTLDLDAGRLMTTTYNQAGVIEAWTDGALTPVHAWAVLKRSPRLVERWSALLALEHPRYVLLSPGTNPMDGDFTDNAAVSRALEESLVQHDRRIVQRWDFPTESGEPGWALVELSGE